MEPSHRTSAPHRPLPERTYTWPGTTSCHAITPSAQSDLRRDKKLDAFEEHLDQYPGAHFLSRPTVMYDDDDDDDHDGWSSDSDSDAEDVEWDAGITDFALFDSDRRRAKATGEALPQKWNGLLQQQVSALGRSVQRSRSDATTDDIERAWKDETVPGLTPDVSPHLADDLDVKSYQGQSAPRPVVPNYLRSRSKSEELSVYIARPDSESAIEEDDELTLAFFPRPDQRRQRPRLAPQRPSLSTESRTLSGRLHSWQRPKLDSYSVQEDAQAERSAELASSSTS